MHGVSTPRSPRSLHAWNAWSKHSTVTAIYFVLNVLLMSFTIYCVNYVMKIDRFHVYDRVIKRLKHGC